MGTCDSVTATGAGHTAPLHRRKNQHMDIIKMENIERNKRAVIRTGEEPNTYSVMLSSPGEHWARAGLSLEVATQRAVEHVTDKRLNGLKFRPAYMVV